MLVNTTTKMDVNRNPTARFVNLRPTTTKLDKHLVKVIALLDRTLIPRKPSVPFVTKGNGKIKRTNRVVKIVQQEHTIVKLVQLLKVIVTIVQSERIRIKVDKLRAKIIATLDRTYLPTNLLVPNVIKDNFKMKTTNQSV